MKRRPGGFGARVDMRNFPTILTTRIAADGTSWHSLAGVEGGYAPPRCHGLILRLIQEITLAKRWTMCCNKPRLGTGSRQAKLFSRRSADVQSRYSPERPAHFDDAGAARKDRHAGV